MTNHNKDEFVFKNSENPDFSKYNGLKIFKFGEDSKESFSHCNSNINFMHIYKLLQDFLDSKKFDIINEDFIPSAKNIIEEDPRFFTIHENNLNIFIKNWIKNNICRSILMTDKQSKIDSFNDDNPENMCDSTDSVKKQVYEMIEERSSKGLQTSKSYILNSLSVSRKIIEDSLKKLQLESMIYQNLDGTFDSY